MHHRVVDSRTTRRLSLRITLGPMTDELYPRWDRIELLVGNREMALAFELFVANLHGIDRDRDLWFQVRAGDTRSEVGTFGDFRVAEMVGRFLGFIVRRCAVAPTLRGLPSWPADATLKVEAGGCGDN